MSESASVLPQYAIPVVVGLAVMLLYPAPAHVRTQENKRGYRTLLVVTVVFAIAGAKLVALMGDRLWPFVPLEHGWQTVVESGRSIVGGLLFGHLASEVTRPLIGYTAPSNDRLAVAVCIGIAVGRFGCYGAGCCLGVPYNGLFSVDGRVPSSLLELGFHLALAGVFFVLERKRVLFGRLFSLYLVVYGVFRFGTEPMRATPKPIELFGATLSVYQVFALALVVVGAAGLTWRSRARLGVVTPA